MYNLLRVERLGKRGDQFSQELVSTMAEDNHHFIPNYVILKEDKIVGSLGVKSALLWWMKSEDTSARDSLTVFNIMDNVMDIQGVKEYIVPCDAKSPYHGLLPRLFETYDKSIDLFLRRL